MTRSIFTKAAAAVAVATFAAGSAQAQTTQNTFISFTGFSQISDPNPAAGAGNTLFIDFLTNTGGVLTPSPTPPTSQTTAATTTGTGDVGSNNFGFTAGTQVTVADLLANPSGFNGVPTIANFVTVGGYTFSLNGTTVAPVQGVSGNQGGFGPISLTQVGTSVFAGFVVNGTVTGGAFGTTGRSYTGSFTTQFNNTTISTLIAGIDAGTVTPSDFSARFDVAPAAVIPEPSTYALMASGVVMLGAFARRRRQA